MNGSTTRRPLPALALIALLAACGSDGGPDEPNEPGEPNEPLNLEEFQVDSGPVGDFPFFPSVAMAPNGRFLTLWRRDASSRIEARSFRASGTAAGPVFQVQTFNASPLDIASLAGGVNGQSVAVWPSSGSPGNDQDETSIQARRFGADGSAQGQQFQVNTTIQGGQFHARAAVGPSGELVITWTEFSRGLLGQRFQADGSKLGGEFQVNTVQAIPGGLINADLVFGVGGTFLAVWAAILPGGDDYDLRAQRFAADGSKLGSEFQVNTFTPGRQSVSRVAALPGGGYVVVWQSDSGNGTDPQGSIQAQRIAADGSRAGGEFQVNTTIAGFQAGPAVVARADGSFVVAWSSGELDGSTSNILAQRFAADGTRLGGEFQVNRGTGSLRSPSISAGADGRFAIVWVSLGPGGQNPTSGSIQGRIFQD